MKSIQILAESNSKFLLKYKEDFNHPKLLCMSDAVRSIDGFRSQANRVC